MLNQVIADVTKARLKKLIQLEQLIISGTEGTTSKKANNTSIVKQVSVISKELQPKDYLRLLMVYFSVFELSQKDKDTMLKSVGRESFKDIVRNFELLDHERYSEGKFKRRIPE